MPDKDEKRYSTYSTTLFLDTVRPSAAPASQRPDPSVYKWWDALGSTCVDASVIVSSYKHVRKVTEPEPKPSHAVNSVYLPGPDRYVLYDNATDVLHLRFSHGQSPEDISQATNGQQGSRTCLAADRGAAAGGLGDVLDSLWSREMADSVNAARRIALDVADTWTDSTAGPMAMEEVQFLACTLQHDLEVLYLVDYCAGHCGGCRKQALTVGDLQSREGNLFRELHADNARVEQSRPADVIQGVDVVYREVFDLETLGWDSTHPTFMFARILDDAIRSQQSGISTEAQVFQGVRVLICENRY